MPESVIEGEAGSSVPEASGSGPLSPGVDLVGRRVLVVGGGAPPWSGAAPDNNGGAIASLAGRSGAAVCVADRDREAASRVADHIRHAGSQAWSVVGDVSDPRQCERLVDEAVEALGAIDGLVLNVGIGEGVGLAGTSVEMWDRVLNVNLRAHFLVVKRALPLMAGGSIVFVSSAAGLRPGTYSPSYDASKAALFALSRHVALEGAPRGVRANAVAPGLIDTPMGRNVSRQNPGRDRVRTALGRQGTAAEVAGAVLYLLSAASSYVTAECLVVDGGLTTLPVRRQPGG